MSNRIIRYLILVSGLLFALVHMTAFASIPTHINVQGRLTDSFGNPLPPGSKSLIFRIYDAQTGGTVMWSGETIEVVSDVNGLWTAVLGTITPLAANVFSDSLRWLEITVDDGVNPPEVLPRVRLTTGPYAFVSSQSTTSRTADTATYALNAPDDADWLVTDSMLTTSSNVSIVRGDAGNFYSGDSSHTVVMLGVACTTSSYYATVSGGSGNVATARQAVVGGGEENTASSAGATVGGGSFNIATAGRSTIAGGFDNTATGSFSTVGGGIGNDATAQYAIIAGGGNGTASGVGSCIVGGGTNEASGQYATVVGGIGNTASGDHAVVVSGQGSRATGDYSFAGGYHAYADDEGSFLWTGSLASSEDVDSLFSEGNNSFTVWSTGGVTFWTGFSFGSPVAAVLNPGSGSWGSISDRHSKTNIRPVDGADILRKVSSLSISRWSYGSQPDSIEHIGPMAQDFNRLFGVGDDDRSIITVDPDGVALAAIKELARLNQELQSTVTAQQNQIDELRSIVNRLTDRE